MWEVFQSNKKRREEHFCMNSLGIEDWTAGLGKGVPSNLLLQTKLVPNGSILLRKEKY